METVARSLYEQVRAERDQLADEVEYLRSQLSDIDIVFPERWKMTPSMRVILCGLMRRHLLTRETAMALIYSRRDGDEPSEKVIDVFVSRLRFILKADGIEISTSHYEGYYLTPDMKARIQTLCEREASKALGRVGAA